MPWDRLRELGSGPGHWRPLAACLGGGRGGIIFLMPPIWPLCQQIVLIFHMEESRDPLESSNSCHHPVSGRALGFCKALSRRELDWRAAVTNPDCFMHKFGHFVSLLYWTMHFFASQKFPWKTRNLGLHPLLVLPPRQKTWGKLLRWFKVRAFPFFSLQQNFISKFVCS